MNNCEDLNELSKYNYYTPDLFNKAELTSFPNLLIVTSSGYSYSYLSVRSFNRNADELLTYLHKLRTNIIVIILTEPCFSLLYTAKVPEYADYHSFRSTKRT